MLQKIILLVFALMCSMAGLDAQEGMTDTTGLTAAEQHIILLKEGTLLVRIPSKARKIETYQAVLDTATLDDKDRERMEKQLAKTIEESERFALDVARAIDSVYAFSDYAFYFDKDTRQIMSGEKLPYQSDLETSIELDLSLPIYILTIGHTPEMSIEGYVIVGPDMEELPRPFPATVTRGGFRGIFAPVFNWKAEVKHIQALNNNLLSYHRKVLYRKDKKK